jgi:hypothetical protein
MNGWNYRVIKAEKQGEIYFTISEVYYDDKDCPVGWVECKKNALVWEEYESLKETISLLSEAFDKPILHVVGDKLREMK